MSDDLVKILQLQSLADLKLNTELARLKGIALEEEGPKATLTAIAQEKKRYNPLSETDISQITLACSDGKWQSWAERETRIAMGELAKIAQKYEDQLLVTNQAFGRVEALKTIISKAKGAVKK